MWAGHQYARLASSNTRGAALLLALIILTLVSTLSGAMVWQQWRSIHAESAERDRSQARWILDGALDWGMATLKYDDASVDHLAEPWAVPLPEVRLSTFLALDEENNSADLAADLPDIFLSADITDMQSRYNLRNLVNKKGELDPEQVKVLEKVFLLAGVAVEKALPLAKAWHASLAMEVSEQDSITPDRNSRLQWLGLDSSMQKRLWPWLVVLPVPTPININTVSAPLLSAVFPDLPSGIAAQIVAKVKAKPYNNIFDVEQEYPVFKSPAPDLPSHPSLDVKTRFFQVTMHMHMPGRELKRSSLVQRNPQNGQIFPIFHEMQMASDS